MPKHDFLTPKAIANRMKAKGLQKLRWFCQVCQKQCRDENGFKCHTSSESHQRQMLIVANSADKFIGGYSEMFEQAFLENLRRRHGTKRLRANVVYNEYIADKMHVHMNATQWTTLSGFVQYLGRTGKCIVDETEKGWYIQYIDRDPRTIARQEELDKKKKSDLDHEERNRAFLERQLRIARESQEQDDPDQHDERSTKLQRGENDTKLSLSLAASALKKSKKNDLKSALENAFDTGKATDDRDDHAKTAKSTTSGDCKMSQNAMERIMHEESRKRKREEEQSRQENWITKGIVVKIKNKRVGDGKYYKKKGVITDVQDRFGARVEILDTKDILQLDQDDLETVIPQVGRRVRIVNGIGRGSVASLVSINVDDFCASIRIETGPRKGQTLERVEYEDICKVAEHD